MLNETQTWWRHCWGWRWHRSAEAGWRRGSWCQGWQGPAGEPGAGRTPWPLRLPHPRPPPPPRSHECSWACLWTGRPDADPPPWPGCHAGSNTCTHRDHQSCVILSDRDRHCSGLSGKEDWVTSGLGPWSRSSCRACSCVSPTVWTRPWSRQVWRCLSLSASTWCSGDRCSYPAAAPARTPTDRWCCLEDTQYNSMKSSSSISPFYNDGSTHWLLGENTAHRTVRVSVS